MKVSIIVAMSENRVIGRAGQMPWHISEDLKRFKRLTMGHHIVMGRKTFESIGRPLPGRRSIVITRNPEYASEGVLIANDLDHALKLAKGDKEVFVIGGAKIYELGVERAQRLYLTLVHTEVVGDVFFPQVNWDEWTLVEDSGVVRTNPNTLDHSFRIYERHDAHLRCER